MRPYRWLLLCLLLAACQATPVVTPPASTKITAAGGLLQESGVSLAVPAGAVSSPVEIEIAVRTPPVAPPEEAVLAGSVYAFTPHGTTFAKAVTISLPAPADAADLVVLRLDNDEDTVWKEVPGVVVQAGQASFLTTHFSYYGVFTHTLACLFYNGGCDEHATCDDELFAQRCTCHSGYTGNGRQCRDIDECASNNGGCDAHATCTNIVGSRTCQCEVGYTGNGISCVDIDECQTSHGGCDPVATCTNTPGGFSCACPAGYSGDGKNCMRLADCAVNNGGCDANATCSGSPGALSCQCLPGFDGDGRTCTDLDECATASVCGPDSTCVNRPGGFRCVCNTGFADDGTGHCQDIDECASNNGGCGAHQACTNTVGAHHCDCLTGFVEAGGVCGDIDECATANGGCDPHATCTNSEGSRICACRAGYVGDGSHCTLQLPDSATVCANAGFSCGAVTWQDLEGGSHTTDCGGCAADEACSTSHRCEVSDVLFCQNAGRNCGTFTGTSLSGSTHTAECGFCSGTDACGYVTPNVCDCAPETDLRFCQRKAAQCGSLTALDNCSHSRTANCGTCPGSDACGTTTPNICSCVPETDATFCSRRGAQCGSLTANDNCGQPRTANCGSCASGLACGITAANVCASACTAETDAELCQANYLCDNQWAVVKDRCNQQRTVNCGVACGAGYTCGCNQLGQPSDPGGHYCTLPSGSLVQQYGSQSLSIHQCVCVSPSDHELCAPTTVKCLRSYQVVDRCGVSRSLNCINVNGTPLSCSGE